MKLLLSALTLALSTKGVHSHGVQVAQCLTTAGNLRIFIEHWHGNIGASSAGTMTIRDDIAGTQSTTSPVAAQNRVQLSGLSGCATGPPTSVSVCSSSANRYNTWVYYEYPGTCGVPVSYTLLSGNTVVLAEACGSLYPTTIAQTYSCANTTLTPPPHAQISGDPHIRGWDGKKYDFHGVCDLVLLHNPGYKNGLGMDVHVRNKRTRQWSFVSSAAVQIGDDTLEVMGGKGTSMYWLNGVKGEDASVPQKLSGYPIKFREMSKKSHEFVVEEVVISTWNAYVRVNFQNTDSKDFESAVGLLGRFTDGKKTGRDNRVIEDADVFGQEWQVLGSEPKLFHDIEGPQHPEKCEIPSATEMRRRLADSSISLEDAQVACSRVSEADFDICVFDVMATNSVDVAGAY